MALFTRARDDAIAVNWIALTRRNVPRVVVVDGAVMDPNTQVALSRLPEPADLIEQQAVELRLLESAAPVDRANRLTSAARCLNSAAIQLAVIADQTSDREAEALASEFLGQAGERFAQGVQASLDYLMINTIDDSWVIALAAIEANQASFGARFWTPSQASSLVKQAMRTLDTVSLPARQVAWRVIRGSLDQLGASLRCIVIHHPASKHPRSVMLSGWRGVVAERRFARSSDIRRRSGLEPSGDEEHAESVFGDGALAVCESAVEFDDAVELSGAAVVGPVGGEVGQERLFPAA